MRAKDSYNEANVTRVGASCNTLLKDLLTRYCRIWSLQNPFPSSDGLAAPTWRGEACGAITFRKLPPGHDNMTPATWTYSGDGVARQSAEGRAIGDIHFSPAFSGESGFDYWICIGGEKRRWALCGPGQTHPIYKGHVLKLQLGKAPPMWILEESWRTLVSRRKLI